MNFEKIELIGFKSFADKQVIQFNDGVTGIVGPNGCGKSNIADAIRWVLGEQSAKSLRGSSMQDVIFNGTQNRKSLSYCEVSLYFDNSNKIFKSLEYDEVCITRKLFRSGESEYYINRKLCRMKDIVELLHECGVSKGGYSIIGQGKIAEIMNSKPEDRRTIFEEAVGIASTKVKKIENERKLQKTRENIIRIIDITSELEGQLHSYEKSAEKTRTYLQLAQELRYNEVNTYLYKADNSQNVKDKINLRISGLEQEQDVKNADLIKAQNDYNSHLNEINVSDVNISQLNEEILKRTVGLEKQMGVTNLYNQRINFLQSEVSRLKQDCSEKLEKITLLTKAINAKSEYIEQSTAEIDKIESRVKQISVELMDVLAKLSEGENMTQDAQNKVLQSVESLADIKMNIGALSGEKNAISTQQQEVVDKVTTLSLKLKQLQEERQLAVCTFDNLAKQINKLKVDIEDGESAISSTNNYISEINNKIYALNSDISSLQARKNVYKGLKDSFTGYPDAVKNLMLSAKNNATVNSKIKGLVASIISTESKYEVAIETALGGAVNNIVTATPDDAQFLIDYLKQNRGGRVTFLPVSSMKSRFDSSEALNSLKLKGALGLATNIVKYDRYFDSVVRFLLGNTLICDTIENAVNIAKANKFAFKIVTLDGDIINPSGSMSGGSRKHEGSNVLSTDRMLEQIEKDLLAKTQEMAKLNSHKQNSLEQVNQMVTLLDENNKKLTDCKQTYASIKEKLLSFDNNINETASELSIYKHNEEQLSIRLTQINQSYSDIELNNEKLYEARENASSDALKHQSQYEQLKKQRDELVEENTVFQTKLATLKHDVATSNEELKRMSDDVRDSNAIIDKNKQNIDANLQIIEQVKLEIEKITLSTEEQSGLNKLREQLANEKDRKIALNDMVAQDDLRKQVLTSELNKIAEKIMGEKIELAKVDSELEYMQQRILEEYQLTYETCKDEKDENYNIAISGQEISRIKRKIATLGTINPNAIEEYENIKVRYDELNAQKNDLESAENDLKSVIKDITNEMLSKFNEGFEQIRVNFKKIFKELFGGGSADLILDYTDVEDPLEAGVEIVAEPPGKKLTKISLLSGGEQALTATAILFAILRLRPMPFCVLDEIEAPLDDANVDRVAMYLQKFANETQFVIITHKKVTMERSNTLFGVTMEEKGVSKIISVKLSDIKDDENYAS